MKRFWLAINSKGIWNLLIAVKYLKNKPLHIWFKEKNFSTRNVSIIWRGFISTISWIGRVIIWKVGNGESISLGADPVIGMGSPFVLPRDLRDYLEDFGIRRLIFPLVIGSLLKILIS